MIDPSNITNYNRSDAELQEFMVFSVLVAGKNARSTASALERLKDKFQRQDSLLNNIWNYVIGYGYNQFVRLIADCRIGCYQAKARSLFELASRDYNLKTCTVQDLESVYGIGSKTARFFILHSRPNARVAVLDTHILHWLRDLGYNAPKTTPQKGSTKYAALELTFLKFCDIMNVSPAVMDLRIWNEYSERNKKSKVAAS